MKNKNKVLVVSPGLSLGGIERASVNTANGLQEFDFEIIFLCLFKKEHFFKLNDGINILEPNEFNISKLSIIRSIKWIRREANRYKPDKILVFNKFYGAITALALFGLKVDFYLSERSSPLFHWEFPFKVINKISFTLNPPKGVIAQTQIAASYQQKYFKKSKVVVVPNSVDGIKLYPEVKRKNVILAVGRTNDHLKGFDLLLESFSLLKNKDWQLHIAGGYQNDGSLIKLAEKLNIQNRVRFLGQIKDISRYFAYAGIFVIPSRSEGFPNSLAEAMVAGCCCVSFDFIAGARDLIQHKISGIIVDNGNVFELAREIDSLILDSSQRERLSKNARLMENKLAIKAVIPEIIKFLN